VSDPEKAEPVPAEPSTPTEAPLGEAEVPVDVLDDDDFDGETEPDPDDDGK
jgi:hypothetical protein